MRSLLSDMLAVWLKAEGVSGCLLESVLACISFDGRPGGERAGRLGLRIAASRMRCPFPARAVYDDRKGLWEYHRPGFQGFRGRRPHPSAL